MLDQITDDQLRGEAMAYLDAIAGGDRNMAAAVEAVLRGEPAAAAARTHRVPRRTLADTAARFRDRFGDYLRRTGREPAALRVA